MELQVPHSFCTKVQKTGDIWTDTCRYRKILRELCERTGVVIIEAEACRDHIHMFVEIPPNIVYRK